MQGWHSQRLLESGDVTEPIVKVTVIDPAYSFMICYAETCAGHDALCTSSFRIKA